MQLNLIPCILSLHHLRDRHPPCCALLPGCYRACRVSSQPPADWTSSASSAVPHMSCVLIRHPALMLVSGCSPVFFLKWGAQNWALCLRWSHWRRLQRDNHFLNHCPVKKEKKLSVCFPETILDWLANILNWNSRTSCFLDLFFFFSLKSHYRINEVWAPIQNPLGSIKTSTSPLHLGVYNLYEPLLCTSIYRVTKIHYSFLSCRWGRLSSIRWKTWISLQLSTPTRVS